MSGLLADHPWDRFGYPPPVGEPYILPDPELDEDMTPTEKAISDILATAEGDFDEAESLRDEAESLRDESDELFRSARRALDEAEAKLPMVPRLIGDKLRKRINENKYR